MRILATSVRGGCFDNFDNASSQQYPQRGYRKRKRYSAIARLAASLFVLGCAAWVWSRYLKASTFQSRRATRIPTEPTAEVTKQQHRPRGARAAARRHKTVRFDKTRIQAETAGSGHIGSAVAVGGKQYEVGRDRFAVPNLAGDAQVGAKGSDTVVKANGAQSAAKGASRSASYAETGGRPRKSIQFHLQPQKMEATLRNGTVYKVPASWSRFHCPWFVPDRSFQLKSLSESRHRVLYSPFRHSMSDGIGHSMAVLNYEIRVAHSLGLAYSHRISNYSSLSVKDTRAVETFFGWGDHVPVQRTEIQHHVCRSENENDSDWSSDAWEGRFKCNTCASIRPGNKFGIKKMVHVPDTLSYVCVSSTRTHQVCNRERAEFITANNEPHTLFQLPTEVCAKPVSDSQFGDTKTYYWHKYWDRHSFPKQLRAVTAAAGQTASRHLTLPEGALNIAVHVRRGDFLEPGVRVKRLVLPDQAYAELIGRALQVIKAEGGVFATLPVKVHIFSEGKVIDKSSTSSHMVDSQDKHYYDPNGVQRDAGWWKALIYTMARKHLAQRPIGGLGAASMIEALRRMEVRLRIAEPTLGSMHDMISADIFIGSKSGLSINAIWALARGVSLMPQGPPIGGEGMPTGAARERVCCTVAFHPSSLVFNTAKFREYWHAYALANGDSVTAAVAAK
jgi:hypothetical protein